MTMIPAWLFTIIVFNLASSSTTAANARDRHLNKHRSSHVFHDSRLFGSLHHHSSNRRSRELSIDKVETPIIRHHRYANLDRTICEFLGCENSTLNPLSSTVWVEKFTQELHRPLNITTQPPNTRKKNKKYMSEQIEDNAPFDNKSKRHAEGQNYSTSMEKPVTIKTEQSEPALANMTSTKNTTKTVIKPAGKMTNRSKAKAKLQNSKLKLKGDCSTPWPTLIRIQDVYPDPLKEYIPGCTKLHRCTLMSGCCSQYYNCAEKDTEIVNLHISVRTLTKNGAKQTFETFSFLNHTSCTCDEVNKIAGSEQNDDPQEEWTTGDLSELENSLDLTEEISNCICPDPFTARKKPEGSCTCDCFDEEFECIKYKRGMGNLQTEWRRCIKTGKCTAPKCYYGKFIVKFGRCPMSEERNRYSNYSS